MHLCIFEDNNADKFEPFSAYRPVFDLVCGILTLRKKILRYFPHKQYSVLCREYLAEITRERNPGLHVNEFSSEDVFFINGAVLPDDEFIKALNSVKDKEALFVKNDRLIAAKVSAKGLRHFRGTGNIIPSIDSFENITKADINCTLIEYSFELLKYHHQEILRDMEYLVSAAKPVSTKMFNGVHLINEDQIFISEGTELKPGVVIDATGGPVLISKNVLVHPNTVIEGPVSIGESSIIKSCSTIYSNVSIGKVCKVGGEVEDSVIQDYSNKQHSGFLGHSYLGSWVNIGADTNCSDLKNNYSPVKILLAYGEVETGLQFLGLLMGDHSKSGINTMFNTGTVAGFSSNIYGSGFPDKYIPSFSWGGSEGFVEYDIEKSINTARIVMGRRKIPFSKSEEILFREIFKNSRVKRLKKEVAP